MESDMEREAQPELAAGSLQRPRPRRNPRLAPYSAVELAFEVECRMREAIASGARPGEEEITALVRAAAVLNERIDVFENRFSRARYRQLLASFITEPSLRPPVRDATWVDLGCGSLNPGAFLFMLLMLGARRGYAIDADDVPDVSIAVRALADVAALALVDPKSLFGELAPSREELLENLRGFDLARLLAGDLGGAAEERLSYRRASVVALPLADAEADVVVSLALLEHVADVDATIAEIARVMRRGGRGSHVINGRDHRWYADRSIHPLDFLRDPTAAELVHGSNRMRPLEFVRRFEQHGFAVREVLAVERVDVPPELRASFAVPFRDLPQEELETVLAQFVVERL